MCLSEEYLKIIIDGFQPNFYAIIELRPKTNRLAFGTRPNPDPGLDPGWIRITEKVVDECS